VLLVTSLGVGTAAVGCLKLHPAESLCVAIAASWVAVFFVSFAAGVFGVGNLVAWPMLGASAVGLAIGWRQLHAWATCRFTRTMALAYTAILVWCVMIQASSPIYAYGNWFGDWFEHYERMIFFSGRFPLDTVFLGRYSLPSRPPMQNVCQAYIAALVNPTFPVFQISSTFLSTLLCLPVFVLVRRLARGPMPSVWIAAAMIALNWPFVVHATFTWTKAFAAFYVTLAIALYLRHSVTRQAISFMCLSAGVLVHYSSAVLLVPLVIWHLVAEARNPRAARTALLVGLPGACMLVPWVAFVRLRFPGGLLSATSSASMIAAAHTAWFANTATNILYSFAPLYPPETWLMNGWADGSGGVFMRDLLFMATMTNFVGSIGLPGVLMAFQELHWRLDAAAVTPPRQVVFWAWLFVGSLIGLGIAHPSKPEWGVCHIAMLPFVASTAAWIAGAWPALTKNARLAMAGLCGVQAGGLLLNAFMLLGDAGQEKEWPIKALSTVGRNNLALKTSYRLTFLADILEPWRVWIFLATVCGVAIWTSVLLAHANPRCGLRR
jgi:hypothetical protein